MSPQVVFADFKPEKFPSYSGFILTPFCPHRVIHLDLGYTECNWQSWATSWFSELQSKLLLLQVPGFFLVNGTEPPILPWARWKDQNILCGMKNTGETKIAGKCNPSLEIRAKVNLSFKLILLLKQVPSVFYFSFLFHALISICHPQGGRG